MESCAGVARVDPAAKPLASWYCVATGARMGPFWTALATRAGIYLMLPVASTDRERLLSGIRGGDRPWIASADAPRTQGRIIREDLSGWLAVAAHPDHAVVLGGQPRGVLSRQLFVPMTPKRIPFCHTEKEVLDRVRLTAARDKEFARKWAGWRFLAIRHDDGVTL